MALMDEQPDGYNKPDERQAAADVFVGAKYGIMLPAMKGVRRYLRFITASSGAIGGSSSPSITIAGYLTEASNIPADVVKYLAVGYKT